MSATIALVILIFLGALLYSSVGHAGASAYLAAMALFGLAPQVMKPTALVLNILVASVTTYKFVRAGSFSWDIFWPFALSSVPFAFLGGYLALPASAYQVSLAIVLIWASIRLLTARDNNRPVSQPRPMSKGIAFLVGPAIGFLAGLVGVGGGIFLSPLLILTGWAETRPTSGISAAFILVNSVAGMLGHLSVLLRFPQKSCGGPPRPCSEDWPAPN